MEREKFLLWDEVETFLDIRIIYISYSPHPHIDGVKDGLLKGRRVSKNDNVRTS